MLYLATLISVLLNDIPFYFKPEERLLAFILVTSLIGPLIKNPLFYHFRWYLYRYLSFSLVLLVVVSFLGIAIGIPNMIGRGGYSGLFNHSMMLGPMAALAMLVTLRWYFIAVDRRQKLIFIILTFFCFITCVATGSRSALLGGIAGLLFFLYKTNQGNMVKYARVIVTIFVFGILTFPIWEPYTGRLSEKMEYTADEGSLTATRDLLWKSRVDEFLTSPLYGIGFASIDPILTTHGFDKETGTIEPGSSWLVALSMTGLLGFVILIILLGLNLRFIIYSHDSQASLALIGSFLSFFIVHMMAEGYIFSAGSGLFFLFWLMLGVCDDYRYTSKLITNLNTL
ncbi:o-antigen polymerase family protein [Pontibacter sp. BAB1700]|nr:o-antigen polymerase family protein [Pontibacter sp. BAB1700]